MSQLLKKSKTLNHNSKPDGYPLADTSESETGTTSAASTSEKGIYKGSWKANKMHGFGVFRWASGRSYAGSWVADVKTGVGVLNFKGGNEYAGEFLNDKREGYGFYQWADNRRFKGWWHENKQHGLGVYFSPESTSAKFGIWQMGKRIKWLNEQETN